MNLFMLLQAQRELKSVYTKSNQDSLLNLKTNASLEKWTEKNRKTEGCFEKLLVDNTFCRTADLVLSNLW